MRRALRYGLLFILPVSALAVESVSLYALFEGKAIVLVDGQRRLLREGEASPEGVRLISTDPAREQAVLEFDRQRETVLLGTVISRFESSGQASETLYVGTGGHFFADGTINGFPVTFLVDTGATAISISESLAKRIGLAYERGSRAVTATASGLSAVRVVSLDKVSVGAIRLRGIEAVVMPGHTPDVPLLGMSFLGRLDMTRKADRLDLVQRY